MSIRRRKDRRRESGAALAEYGLLVAGITMVSLVAVTVLGSKVGGLIGSVATLLPGAYTDQNAPVQVGQMLEIPSGLVIVTIPDEIRLGGATTTSSSEPTVADGAEQ